MVARPSDATSPDCKRCEDCALRNACWKINGGGEKPTDFEIMQADENHLKLIYAAPGTGGWGEATWWAFKKKQFVV